MLGLEILSSGSSSGPAVKDGSREISILEGRVRDLERQLDNQKQYYLNKLRSKEPLVPSYSYPKRLKKTAHQNG